MKTQIITYTEVCQNSAILCVQNFAQNWPSCAELTKWHRNRKNLQILFCNIALSSAVTAATAGSGNATKHLGVK